ncbi:hypothetical protein MMC26_003422 [Xylographa opegraphella]|nr:hypothetical protein [Xylographa opegraphella]
MALDVALAMMNFASQLGDVPFIYRLKPGWASSSGTDTKFDCSRAIAKLPRSSEPMDIEFRRPRIITVGACAIGIYVTKPDPSGLTAVTETWDHVVDWVAGANGLNTAVQSSGWVIETVSGIQVCFWEPEVVDPQHICELPGTYTMKRPIPMTIATCLDIMHVPRAKTSSIGTITASSSASSSTSTSQLTSNLPASTSPSEDVIIGVYRPVPNWTKPGFSAEACFDVVRSLHKAPISTTGNQMFMKYPQVYANDICTCAFFFTNPPKLGQGTDFPRGGMNFQMEAHQLLMRTVLVNGQGGFVDLPNGIQIVLYDSGIDPRHICWLTSRVSLRACLDNMVRYYKPGPTTTGYFTGTESSVAPTSRSKTRP